MRRIAVLGGVLPTTLPAGTAPNHQNVVAEWHMPTPDSAVDPASRRELLRVDWPQLRGRYVFGDYSRLVTNPLGPSNYGRIMYMSDEDRHGLHQAVEVRGFAEAAGRLGLTDPSRPAAAFPQTLAVLGIAEDARGELYVLGNRTGVTGGTGGVLLRITGK